MVRESGSQMAIFAILAPSETDIMKAELQRLFPGDYLRVGFGQWLVSAANASAKDVSDAVGISDGRSGTGIVFLTAGYFGRSNPEHWEWIASRLTAVMVQPTAPAASGTR